MPIRIAHLQAAHIPALMQVEERLYGDSLEGPLGPQLVHVCARLFPDVSTVALEADAVVGYHLAVIRDDLLWCVAVAVVPERRRTRVLPGLLDAALAGAPPEVRRVRFTAAEAEAHLIAFYRGLGARVVERSEDHYGPGDHRLCMELDGAALDALAARVGRVVGQGSARSR